MKYAVLAAAAALALLAPARAEAAPMRWLPVALTVVSVGISAASTPRPYGRAYLWHHLDRFSH